MSTKENKEYCQCECQDQICYECEQYETSKKPPRLSTDCIIVESYICSRRVNNIAELAVPVEALEGLVEVEAGGIITPPVTITPNINQLVSQTTVVKDMVVITGYLPVNLNISGEEASIELNLPFQSETKCKGICPEDRVTVTPFKIEASVAQGIEEGGITEANILLKVVMSTTITVTRPIVTKAKDLKLVKDVVEDRCQMGCNNG